MMRVDFGWLLILLIRRKNTQLVRKMKQRFPIAVNVGKRDHGFVPSWLQL